MLKIIDNRLSIVEKCREAGFDAIHGDYFEEIINIPNHVLCTASNPHFTFGGGIDYGFKKNFPLYCKEKQFKRGGNERIGNIIFAVSVDFNLDSNEALVLEALTFAKSRTMEHETLCITGIGTMIGGLAEETFVELLVEVFGT